jgi:hypothetical protein
VNARAPSKNCVEAFFSKPVVRDSLRIAIDGLDIIASYIDPKRKQMVVLATATQEEGREYRIDRAEAYDRFGNGPVPPDEPIVFEGTAEDDTTKLRIQSISPEILLPGSQPVEVVFNTVLSLAGGDSSYIAADPEGRDLTITQTRPNMLAISPAESWIPGTDYEVAFDTTLVLGYEGNVFPSADSSVVKFRVMPADTLGKISGTIEDPYGNENSLYRIFVKELDSERIWEIEKRGPGVFLSEPVLPGFYISYAYRDDDEDGELFTGSFDPYRHAEQVFSYMDTVDVIPRWTNEDIFFSIQQPGNSEETNE